MNVLFLISIIQIRLIVGILDLDSNTQTYIKILADSPDSSRYERLIGEYKQILTRYVENICKNYGFENENEIQKEFVKGIHEEIENENENENEIENEIENENENEIQKEFVKGIHREIENEIIEDKKSIYFGKNLLLLYIKKTFDILQELVNKINNLNTVKCRDFLNLEEVEEENFYNFLRLANEFITKYENKILTIALDYNSNERKISSSYIENFIRKYKEDLKIPYDYFKKINITNWVLGRGFKTETKDIFKKKYNLLQKIMSFKNNITENTFFHQQNFDITIECSKYNKIQKENSILDSDFKTIEEIKSDYIYETKTVKFKLSNHRDLVLKFISVLKSKYKLQETAIIADNIEFKENNNLNLIGDSKSGIYLYKKAVNEFMNQLSEFYNLLEETVFEKYSNWYSSWYSNWYSNEINSQDYSTNILFYILESHLNTNKNFKEKVDKTFNLILNDNTSGENEFECMQINDIFKNTESILKNYYKTKNIMRSCDILVLNIYHNTAKSNSILFRFLNDKKDNIYNLIIFIKNCLNSNNPYEFIYNELNESSYLQILLNKLIFNQDIVILLRVLETLKKNEGLDDNINTYRINYDSSFKLRDLKTEFYNKMKDLIKYPKQADDPSRQSKEKTIFTKIIFDMLNIIANNIIQEKNII